MRAVKAGQAGAVGRGLAVAVLLACATGCYWQRYPRLVETHLSVLLDFGRKLEALAIDRRPVAPERWGEFTYPLERARDFSRIAAKRYPGRESLLAFDQATGRYAELVADPRLLDGPDAPVEVARRLAALREAAKRTRELLAREQESG